MLMNSFVLGILDVNSEDEVGVLRNRCDVNYSKCEGFFCKIEISVNSVTFVINNF